jgi:uncharacterized membrane protein YeaQ/YmgE (transglycosylase-associated protein family)
VNILLWFAVGSLLGWLAGVLAAKDARRDQPPNIVGGITGAMFGGLVLTPVAGAGSIGFYELSVPGLFLAFLGAIVSLGIMHLLRSGRIARRMDADAIASPGRHDSARLPAFNSFKTSVDEFDHRGDVADPLRD